ncbi:hypothetical protein ASPCAL14713 [Aspergillus calidoustus]|uniref:Uncharacterized protein n=1 Tax=Aspergillus calidoustus TaxID=454130 RepID=A0A0U5CK93_ASPCI|nr:hypothetical protein ASPCAL14713 [Aspergillus calidoustus]
MELTVAEVSGLIAAGVFVLQILIPLAIPWVLIAFLSQENSIITWTVLGRFLHSSLWPTILSSSTAETANVPWRVFLTSWGQTITLFIISVAAICSPLGLYTSIEPASSPTSHSFQYVGDTSAFGFGTPARSTGPFTRFCGGACPGTVEEEVCETRGLMQVCNSTYETRIPSDLLNVFNEGATAFSPTVSSIFDMQYRMYRNSTDPKSVLSWFTKPDYRTMSLLLLEDDVRLVEGLITDLHEGGIGFRNHTAPSEASLKYGASWDEDILFIEPETQCVPLNLSIHVITPPWNNDEKIFRNMTLVDDGGFSNLPRTTPDMARRINGQADFDLRDRAYKAAWVNNYYTMLFFNLTDPDSDSTRIDSSEGQGFDMFDEASRNFSLGFSSIQTNVDYGAYLDLTRSANRTYNPHNVTAEHFAAASTTCAGTTSGSPANINSSLITCGLVMGAATRTDGGNNLILDPQTPWKLPLYSCATAIKAVVKTVSLEYNGTGFDALTVHSLKPKEYPSDAAIPIWGVEDITRNTINDAPPMWGIVGPNATDLESTITKYNISTHSAKHLYLPGYMDQFYGVLRGLGSVRRTTSQNLPGVEFYNQALQMAYTVGLRWYESEADYSGADSHALYAKWQKLSKTAEGTASIINLIWTDVATNAVVGTKGWGLSAVAANMGIPSSAAIEKRDVEGGSVLESASVPIMVYGSHIRYRIPFAVPAFVTLGITTLLLGMLIVLLIMRRTGLKRMTMFLESTSVGRILSPFIQPAEAPRGAEAETEEKWVKRVGTQKVLITTDSIKIDSEVLEHRRLLVPEPEEEHKRAKPDVYVNAL